MKTDGLTDEDLPGLFEAADTASLDGQWRYLRATRFKLLLAVAAAATGVLTWRIGSQQIDVAAIGTAAVLVTMSLTEFLVALGRPEDRWYDGRALAESAKSLAWRYAVGGVPFAKRDDEEEVRRRFVEQMSFLLKDAPDTSITPSTRPAITARMRELRSADLSTRRAAYLTCRIIDQQSWYAGNARFNEKKAQRWRTCLVAVEVLGIIAALGKAVGYFDFDLAGLVAAIIAALTAWMNVKQFTTLARAYTFAATELSLVCERVELVTTEENWAAEVADSEEAVSREHRMWRASRSRR